MNLEKLEIEVAVDEIIRVLSQSQTIKDWTTNIFGKNPSFILGVIPEVQAEQQNCPAVMVYGATTNQYKTSEITFYFGFAIVSDKVDYNPSTKIKKNLGFFRAEKFRELCIEEIRKSKISGIVIKTETVPETYFPIWESMAQITLNYPNLGRR